MSEQQSAETTAVDYDDPASLSGFTAFDGISVANCGDDGDVLILGHHDDEATWAAFNAFHVYYEGSAPDASPEDYHDIRRVFGVFSEHSEGCEREDCTCREDNNCAACLCGDHDACEGDAACDCGPDYDHEQVPSGCLLCECYCDEYAWWVAQTKTGHPITWVSFSYEKARSRRDATATSPGPTT